MVKLINFLFIVYFMVNLGNSTHIELGSPVEKQDVGELKKSLATALRIPVRKIKLFLNHRGGSLNLGGVPITRTQERAILDAFSPYRPTLNFNCPDNFNPNDGYIFSEKKAYDFLTDWNLEVDSLPEKVFPFLFYGVQGLPDSQVGLMVPSFGLRVNGNDLRLTRELVDFLTPGKTRNYRQGFAVVRNSQSCTLSCFPETSILTQYSSQIELEEALRERMPEIIKNGYVPQIIRPTLE
jgi:hypothetical protein